MPDPGTDRLPRTVEPDRYELTITPDIAEGTFAGDCRAQVRVHEPVSEVVLNSIELDIHSAEMVAEDGTALAGSVRLDDAQERAMIALTDVAGRGMWWLRLTFSGTLNDKLHGFYRSRFKDENGVEQIIATTQFEATDARRAFPCWDEPDFKAIFAVTLIVDDDLTAISNGAVTSEVDLGNGKRQVTFAETMPMSTYLVAFVVGPFELTDPVEVNDVPLRIACTPGKQHLTGYATEAGAAALRFLEGYFEIPYPSDKLDHVAIPDFAFGAMENLGCVTYRETALLVDRSAASRLELQRVAEVIAHETAHMWFGDLVTMKWWNGIWLNEAFATFMELTTVNDLRPDWEIWVTFGVGRGAAMVTDGLRNTRPVEFPVGRPEEAEAMFDVLTYQKGAAVLRMLEQYLGPEPFRKGIVGYLDEHRHGNTETTDLWDAIEAASGEPARAVMDSWILQGGYPLVSIRLGEDNRVHLSQRRFLYSGGESDERWQVPLNLRYSTNGTVRRTRLLLADTATAVELPGQVDWIVVNDGAWGFYRVRYEPPLLQRLTEVMRQELGPLERLSLVSDTWASVLAGHSVLTHFLDMVVLLQHETDPDVWAAVLGPLGLLDRIISDDDRPVLQAFVRRVVGHAFERLSWDPSPGESERAGTLRGRLLLALGTLGADRQVQAEAGRRHAAYLEDRSSLAPDLVTPTVTVVAYAGGEDVFDTMLQQFRTATTPQNEMRYLFSLAAPQKPDLVGQALDLSLTSEVRTQDAPYLIGSVVASRAGSRLGWAFLEEHWETIIRRFPENTVPRMIEGITSITDAGLAHQIHRFLDAHPTSHEQLIAQSRERLDINVAFATRIAGQLPDTLRTK